MNDKDLYAQILGIRSPWEVTEVRLDLVRKEVVIRVNYDSELPTQCPICNKSSQRHDHLARKWRHLDTCQMRTFIECDVPRADCPSHGAKQMKVPWAEERSKFTALFEGLIILWLQNASVTAVSKSFRISWDQASRIQEKAVQRGLARRKIEPVKDLGIDETSFQKRHEYVTILLDRRRDVVIDVLDNRKAESLDDWFKKRSAAEKQGYRTISLDMWDPFIKAIRDNVPDWKSKTCFDRFHVMQHFNKAIDKIRAEEHRGFDKSGGGSCLTKTRYQWLRNSEKTDNRSRVEFMRLTRSNLKTARAWAIKETANRLWDYQAWEWARKKWTYLCSWMSRSRLEPIVKVGRMIKSYFWGILNTVIMKASNAMLEAKNACIQKIKARACGFRNRARFRMAILFHLGGLDMMPNAVKALGL